MSKTTTGSNGRELDVRNKYEPIPSRTQVPTPPIFPTSSTRSISPQTLLKMAFADTFRSNRTHSFTAFTATFYRLQAAFVVLLPMLLVKVENLVIPCSRPHSNE